MSCESKQNIHGPGCVKSLPPKARNIHGITPAWMKKKRNGTSRKAWAQM